MEKYSASQQTGDSKPIVIGPEVLLQFIHVHLHCRDKYSRFNPMTEATQGN